jgi:hypothetical protein
MDTIYSEVYRLMEKLPDGDLNLCFDEEGNEMCSPELSKIQIQKQHDEDFQCYDNPLVIVRETQIIIQ